jgi:hypothetical protein
MYRSLLNLAANASRFVMLRGLEFIGLVDGNVRVHGGDQRLHLAISAQPADAILGVAERAGDPAQRHFLAKARRGSRVSGPQRRGQPLQAFLSQLGAGVPFLASCIGRVTLACGPSGGCSKTLRRL